MKAMAAARRPSQQAYILEYPLLVAGLEHHSPGAMDDTQCECGRSGAGVVARDTGHRVQDMAYLFKARDWAGDPSRAGLGVRPVVMHGGRDAT